MNNLKLSTKWKRISMVLAGMIGLSTLSFNCAPSLFQSASYSSGSRLGTFSTFGKVNTPVSLLTGEQIFQSMANVTGQSLAITNNQRNEYNSRFNSFSATDSMGNFNSPMLLAATSLAGEMCNGLVAKEKALAATARRYFQNINFNATPAVNTLDAYLSSIEVLAVSAWGRSLTSEERTAFTEYFAEFKSNIAQMNNQATDNLAITSCAVVLSSFDALIY